MPKSRRRKPKRPAQQRTQQRTRQRSHGPIQPSGGGWGDFEPWARAMVAADNAEARGKAREALDVMEAFATGPDGEGFWRPWRAAYLLQIALLEPVLPAWAYARWVCHQALQHLPDGRPDRRGRALELAVELRGGRGSLPGDDEADAMARVIDRDWVYRQLALFEHGLLDRFIATTASSALLERAGAVREWSRVPMGGYAYVGSTPATSTWADLRTGEEHVIGNIGSSVLVAPGEHVIGRLVPSPSGELFDVRPMVVSAEMARGVAAEPEGWFDVLAVHRREDPEWEQKYFPSYDPALLSDVPQGIWQLTLLRQERLSDVAGAADEWLARAVLRAAERELDGAVPPGPEEGDLWPCVAAALLDPTVVQGLAHAAGPDDVPHLDRIGELVTEPAAQACRNLALQISLAA